MGPDSALGFGLTLPSGTGDKFQQVFISAHKLNYKAPETKWGSWANAPALENCVSGSDKIEGLTWQMEFSVQWKWLSKTGQKVIHSIESNHQSMIISCLSIGKWKMTEVSFIGSALPDCLLVGHCAEPRTRGYPETSPLGVHWPQGSCHAMGRTAAGEHKAVLLPWLLFTTSPHIYALSLSTSVEVQKAF